MNTAATFEGLFERKMTFPDILPQERLSRLVGLDNHKARLSGVLSVLVNPSGLDVWARRHHPSASAVLKTIRSRPPLVILAGDVGSGKTELAETIGDQVARQEGIDITLLPLSLAARGQGRVGEMTQLISAAFDYTAAEASRLARSSGKAAGAVILLVDEADALAQSREAAQMHHEDRAGVNAFIRGVDRLGNGSLPAAVIMCTNRLTALDPAVKRRAAEILTFGRPDTEQRRAVISRAFGEFGFSSANVDQLVAVTGEGAGRPYGFTFSDLTQRLIPTVVLDAYPHRAVSPARAIELARTILPTPPFQEKAL